MIHFALFVLSALVFNHVAIGKVLEMEVYEINQDGVKNRVECPNTLFNYYLMDTHKSLAHFRKDLELQCPSIQLITQLTPDNKVAVQKKIYLGGQNLEVGDPNSKQPHENHGLIVVDGYVVQYYHLFRRRVSSCPDNQYQCNSNDCISRSKVCNGKSDCKDSSDETGCIYIKTKHPMPESREGHKQAGSATLRLYNKTISSSSFHSRIIVHRDQTISALKKKIIETHESRDYNERSITSGFAFHVHNLRNFHDLRDYNDKSITFKSAFYVHNGEELIPLKGCTKRLNEIEQLGEAKPDGNGGFVHTVIGVVSDENEEDENEEETCD